MNKAPSLPDPLAPRTIKEKLAHFWETHRQNRLNATYGDYVAFKNLDLRDGRQCDGYEFIDENEEDPDHELDLITDMARQNDAVRYDSMEVGTPANGTNQNRESRIVKAVTAATTHSTVTAFTPMGREGNFEGINASFAALEQAIKQERGEIALLISTGARFRDVQGESLSNPKKLLQNATDSIEYTMQKFAELDASFPQLLWYIEGATETERDLLVQFNRELLKTAFSVGSSLGYGPGHQRVVAVQPDTNGLALPHEYGGLFRMLNREVPEARKFGAVWGAHTHNDLGQAVPNTLAAVNEGAREVHVNTLGIGERAGNAHAAGTAMGLAAKFPHLKTGLNMQEMQGAANLVEAYTAHTINPNEELHGDNYNSTSAELHSDRILKAEEQGKADPHLTFDAKLIGNESPEKVKITPKINGKQLKRALGLIGIPVTIELANELAITNRNQRAKPMNTRTFAQRYLCKTDYINMLEENPENRVNFLGVSYRRSGGMETAVLEVEVCGKELAAVGTSEKGSFDAIMDAMKKIMDTATEHGLKLSYHDPKPAGIKEGASDEVFVEALIECNGKGERRSFGTANDSPEAGIRAVINAINSYEWKEDEIDTTADKLDYRTEKAHSLLKVWELEWAVDTLERTPESELPDKLKGVDLEKKKAELSHLRDQLRQSDTMKAVLDRS